MDDALGLAAAQRHIQRAEHEFGAHEKHVHADAGYQGAKKREALKDCTAEFVVARRRSTYKKLEEADPVRKLIEQAEHATASIRAKVEHVYHVVLSQDRCAIEQAGVDVIDQHAGESDGFEHVDLQRVTRQQNAVQGCK